MHSCKASILAFAFFVTSAAYGQCRNVEVKSLAPPVYPAVANVAKIEGAVKVHVSVSADGKVASAKGSGAHEILNRASEENIRLWTFSAPSAACDITVTYVYKLEGKPSYYARSRVILELPLRVEIISEPGIVNP